MTYGQYPFGLVDVKLYAAGATPGTAVQVPAGRVLEVTPTVNTVELTGYNGPVATDITLTGADVRLEHGGVNFDVLAKVTGGTVVTSGTTPNEVKRLPMGVAGLATPNIRAEGKALGSDAGDAWVDIKSIKFSPPAGSFTEGAFYISNLTGRAVRDASGVLYELAQHETATTLAALA